MDECIVCGEVIDEEDNQGDEENPLCPACAEDWEAAGLDLDD